MIAIIAADPFTVGLSWRVVPVMPKEPLDWLTLFRQQINEICNYLTVLEKKEPPGEHPCTPAVDISDTADSFIVELDLPGFARDDISVSICCNTLIIEGVKREEPRGENVTYICLERCFGRFCKTIEIPPGVDIINASARYEKGVLAVSFHRLRDKAIIRQIPIE